jgi:hypothetical protein
MAESVYLLCAVTSLACMALLLRGYTRSRTRFLLWCSICFAGFAANNVILFVDKVVYPDTELVFAGLTASLWRGLVALVGLAVLVVGLVVDMD